MADTEEARVFPAGFMWGTATAAYQIEGGASSRAASIWDTFASKPGKTLNGDTGAVACEHYERYRHDVQLLRSLGTPYYRLSISWPRLLPTSDEPSASGLQFYRDLFTELLANGITPVVTLYHWDLPQRVEDDTGGWCGNGRVVDEFAKYARTCFESFGDVVKWWITLNEPWCSAFLGYEIGEHAPGIDDAPGQKLYIAGHNLLRAHAKAVHVYRTEFEQRQSGKIGITLNANWSEPLNDSETEAAERDVDFVLGWFADPVYQGDYPERMRKRIGDRLPTFTDEEKKLLKGSSDFFGLNHYSSQLVSNAPTSTHETSYWNDKGTTYEMDKAWESTDMGWSIVPWGFRKLLCYIHKKYKPKGGIIVTENGMAANERDRMAAAQNTSRVKYYAHYIGEMHNAIKLGADVRGYFLWSFMDNFEWAYGYSKRFGLYFVDYDTQERVPKAAVAWYRGVVKQNALHSR